MTKIIRNIQSKSKLDDPIATTPKCRGGRNYFPQIALLYP